MKNNKELNNTYRQDEPRRKMARLPASAGIVTAIGVGSIALLGSFFYPDWFAIFFLAAFLIAMFAQTISRDD